MDDSSVNGFVTNLPQGLGNCKPFDWNYVDGFFD